ncbi:hypothetical protein D9M69_602320 [compost metagenome]
MSRPHDVDHHAFVETGQGILHGDVTFEHQQHVVVLTDFAFLDEHRSGFDAFGTHVSHHFHGVRQRQVVQRRCGDQQARRHFLRCQVRVFKNRRHGSGEG